MSPIRPVYVARGSNPFEVAMLAASLMVGAFLVLLPARPRSVVVAMPVLVQVLWECGLVLAGIVGLTGITWRGRITTALGIEMAGLAILGTVTSMYGIALFAVGGIQALPAGSFVIAIAVASWWRVAQVIRDGRRINLAIERGRVADVPILVEEQE